MKKVVVIVVLLLGIFFYSDNKNNSNYASFTGKPFPVSNYYKMAKCIQSKDTDEFLSNKFYELEDELETYIKNYSYAISYKEINSDYSYNYNQNNVVYGASIIKAPFAISIYKDAEKDPDILDKVLTYQSKYYIEGTGIIWHNLATKTKYTIRELVKYMIEDSDNVAYYMLLDEFDKNEYKKDWQALGATTIFTGADKFSSLNAKDATLYMDELYKYLQTNTILSKELGTYFINAAKVSVMQKELGTPIYFKYGLANIKYHEIAIVTDTNPYILSILTTGYPKYYESYIKKVTVLTKEMHEEHWQDLTNYCLQYLK